MPHHRSNVADYLVALGDDERQVYGMGEGTHRLQAILVLNEWVNVGVIPEAGDIEPLLPEPTHRIDGAGTAAGVEKDFSHFSLFRPFPPFTQNRSLDLIRYVKKTD